eukprot:TRINITY_DN1199_c0_g1_i1.p1 TRINITY_DN1199_c0_g1~~TRINITY_DN1199_c0_g1_i1.p1  ORF type:complete len:267 (+),score=58.33 TRINITY_DN1199_c0_g1_i1:34-801(+)
MGGNESKLFMECFPNGVRTLNGGVDSGFSKVKPEEYAPRLYHVKGNSKKQVVNQVPLSVDSINCSDVFVLDLGLQLIQFNGVKASPHEKRAGNMLMNNITSERNGKVKDKDTVDKPDEDTSACKKFWESLPGDKPDTLPEESCGGKVQKKLSEFYKDWTKKLYHVENDTVTQKQEGKLDKSILAKEGDDALIVDTGAVIYLWIGLKSSLQEKGEAMSTAIKMLGDQKRPMETQIVRVIEGKETKAFMKCFNASTA